MSIIRDDIFNLRLRVRKIKREREEYPCTRIALFLAKEGLVLPVNRVSFSNIFVLLYIYIGVSSRHEYL